MSWEHDVMICSIVHDELVEVHSIILTINLTLITSFRLLIFTRQIQLYAMFFVKCIVYYISAQKEETGYTTEYTYAVILT